MQFNEFQRRLNHCHVDEGTKYILTHVFEVLMENNKQLDIMAGLLTQFAQTLDNFTTLHEDTQAKLKQMMAFGKMPGVEVHSVRNEEES